MLLELVGFMVVGLLAGFLPSNSSKYAEMLPFYLAIFFGTTFIYALNQMPIDLKLFLLPLVFTLAYMIVLKFRNKIV